MPQPTRGDVHVNRPLTNISIAYIQKAVDFVADKVFPNIPVMKQSDRYFKYTKDYWFRTGAKKRGPGTESAGSGFAIDNTPTYFCDVWSHHIDIDDQTRSNADQPLDLDRDGTLFVTQNLLIRREIQFMSSFMTTGIWTGFKVAGTAYDFDLTTQNRIQWDLTTINQSTSEDTPMSQIDFLKSQIKSQTGFEPNTLVVSQDVFYALRNNLSVLDRIKYTQKGIVTAELLASLFGVEKFLVAGAVLNSADEGAAGNFAFMSSNQALLVYANPSPSILQPSGGYTFGWQGLFGAGGQGNRVKTFRIEPRESDRIEGEMAFAMVQTGADLGVLLTSVLATA